MQYSPTEGLIMSRALAKSLASKNVHRRKMGQYAATHDLAHWAQDEQAQSTPNRVEGGAEVFARRLAKKKLGLTAKDLGPQSYSGAAKKFRKRHGMREAMKGQFRS